MLSREAPPRQEVDGRREEEDRAHIIDAVPDDGRAPARRPGHRHPVPKPLTSLPFGSVELGLFLLVAFVLWWTTRSWLLTLLLGLGWLGVVGASRTLHRWRNASVERRRFSRERLTSIALVLFVIVGCL